jgi:hypothetical protein
MEKELTFMQMVQHTKENGKKINNMDLEKNHGQMVLTMKVSITKERNTEKES